MEHASKVAILGISGSGRKRSYNSALLEAAKQLLPPDIWSEFANTYVSLDVEETWEALDHLDQVLGSRASDCGCLTAFLELTAKEAVLKKDDEAVNKSILWGRRTCEAFCRTHAESGAAPSHRGHPRAGVDV